MLVAWICFFLNIACSSWVIALITAVLLWARISGWFLMLTLYQGIYMIFLSKMGFGDELSIDFLLRRNKYFFDIVSQSVGVLKCNMIVVNWLSILVIWSIKFYVKVFNSGMSLIWGVKCLNLLYILAVTWELNFVNIWDASLSCLVVRLIIWLNTVVFFGFKGRIFYRFFVHNASFVAYGVALIAANTFDFIVRFVYPCINWYDYLQHIEPNLVSRTISEYFYTHYGLSVVCWYCSNV